MGCPAPLSGLLGLHHYLVGVMNLDEWFKLPKWKRDDELTTAILSAEDLKQWRNQQPWITKLKHFIWNLFNDQKNR